MKRIKLPPAGPEVMAASAGVTLRYLSWNYARHAIETKGKFLTGEENPYQSNAIKDLERRGD